MIFIDFRKIIKEGVMDFSKFDHSMFNFDSLKRLLFILSMLKAEVYFVHFPGDEISFKNFKRFWIFNCYPGMLIDFISIDEAQSTIREYDEGRDGKLYAIISHEEVTPISEDDMILAFHYLKD